MSSDSPRKTLPSFWVKHRNTACRYPRKPACYVLNCDGNIYIGSTLNLRSRMTQHNLHATYGAEYMTPWGICQELTVKYKLSRRFGDWMMWEARLIKRLQPNLNVKGTSKNKRRWDTSKGTPMVRTILHGHECLVWASVSQFLDCNVPLLSRQERA